MCIQRIDHNGPGSTPAQWFDQCSGKGIYDPCIAIQHHKKTFDAIQYEFKSAAVAEQADRNKQPHQVRNNTDSRFESPLRSFYKGIENIDAFINTPQHDQEEDQQDDPVAECGRE